MWNDSWLRLCFDFAPTHTKPIGSNQPHPRPRARPHSIASMATNISPPQLPKIQFRVLIIGRANAGKTTILQRVCDTTESPTVYRQINDDERVEVCHSGLTVLPVLFHATQTKLFPSMEVSDKRCCLLSLLNSGSAWRAQYRGWTCVLRPHGLCFPWLAWHREWWYRGTRHTERIHSTQGQFKPAEIQTTRNMVRAVVCWRWRLLMVIYFQVLHPDGQSTTRAWTETFQGNLPVLGSEWWVIIDTGNHW